jgi:predicted nucleic acid-binding protein
MDAQSVVICDTDVLIDYWNEGAARHAEVCEVIESMIGADKVTISVISWLELLRGVQDKSHQTRILKRLHHLSVLMLNDAISRRSMELMRQYHLSHGLQIPDGLIAATALVTGLPLYTFNVKDYRFIEGLRLFGS